MATADSLDKKAAAEKAARAKESEERLAEAKKRVAKLRAAKSKYDFKVEGDLGRGKLTPRITAYEKGTTKYVGSIILGDLKNSAREIESVHVADTVRRQGLATALYLEAKRLGLKPAHSPLRTKEGDAFARNVGGDVPTKGNSNGFRVRDAKLIKEQSKKANKEYGRRRAQIIATEREFRRKMGLDTYNPATQKAPKTPPPAPRPPGIVAGLNALNRLSGPLGFLPTILGGAAQIANARKPPAMQF